MILCRMETTHMQDHVAVVIAVVYILCFFEGLDVVVWLLTMRLSFFSFIVLPTWMIHFTKRSRKF